MVHRSPSDHYAPYSTIYYATSSFAMLGCLGHLYTIIAYPRCFSCFACLPSATQTHCIVHPFSGGCFLMKWVHCLLYYFLVRTSTQSSKLRDWEQTRRAPYCSIKHNYTKAEATLMANLHPLGKLRPSCMSVKMYWSVCFSPSTPRTSVRNRCSVL